MTATTAVVLTFAPALLGSLVALACDALDRRRWGVLAAGIGLAVSGVAGLTAAFTVGVAQVGGVISVGGPFSAVCGLIGLFASVAVFGGYDASIVRRGGGASVALVGFGAAASALVACTSDLTLLLVGIESAAVCAYALVSLGSTRRADEAAMKYFVQSAVATAFFVFGLAILVGVFVPDGRYTALASALDAAGMQLTALAGALLIISALAFKIGAAPFHSWTPDAYETAPPDSSAFLASGPKLGALAALAVFSSIVMSGTLAQRVTPVLAVLSILSVLVGSLAALRQTSYTRMLAYAGVAQVGYALIAVTVMSPLVVLFFAGTYALATTGTFLAATEFRRAKPDWDGSIAGLAGVGRRRPGVSIALGVLLVSLAGIPPLLGFWGKLQVFAAVIVASARDLVAGSGGSGWLLAVVAVVGLLGSVISVGYYGSVLRSLFLDVAPAAIDDEGPDATVLAARTLVTGELPSGTAGAAVIVVAIAVVMLGLVPLAFGASTLMAPFIAK